MQLKKRVLTEWSMKATCYFDAEICVSGVCKVPYTIQSFQPYNDL